MNVPLDPRRRRGAAMRAKALRDRAERLRLEAIQLDAQAAVIERGWGLDEQQPEDAKR